MYFFQSLEPVAYVEPPPKGSTPGEKFEAWKWMEGNATKRNLSESNYLITEDRSCLFRCVFSDVNPFAHADAFKLS